MQVQATNRTSIDVKVINIAYYVLAIMSLLLGFLIFTRIPNLQYNENLLVSTISFLLTTSVLSFIRSYIIKNNFLYCFVATLPWFAIIAMMIFFLNNQ